MATLSVFQLHPPWDRGLPWVAWLENPRSKPFQDGAKQLPMKQAKSATVQLRPTQAIKLNSKYHHLNTGTALNTMEILWTELRLDIYASTRRIISTTLNSNSDYFHNYCHFCDGECSPPGNSQSECHRPRSNDWTPIEKTMELFPEIHHDSWLQTPRGKLIRRRETSWNLERGFRVQNVAISCTVCSLCSCDHYSVPLSWFP